MSEGNADSVALKGSLLFLGRLWDCIARSGSCKSNNIMELEQKKR